MRKGTRVYVQFDDISASLHTEDEINPILAECCGWVKRDTKEVLEIVYCRYPRGCEHRDGIAIPKGCVRKMEVI